MFLGTYTIKVDEQGRFFLPSKFRDQLVDGLAMVKGQEYCVSVYPLSQFEKLAHAGASTRTSLREVRDFQRLLGSGGGDDIPDKQGRVTLPVQLREYAGLERDAVLTGVIDRLEIWNPEAWEAYITKQEPSFANLNEAAFASETGGTATA
ncbi:MAG: division/cell wall cluster transcriptional repressor MraZ [Propionibacteriaceae bacterium]|jgi:MraZ protein|nr:division/cell wall cluster transcriptional repressor MraZ [Propionibacteriaceae bacterium]